MGIARSLPRRKEVPVRFGRTTSLQQTQDTQKSRLVVLMGVDAGRVYTIERSAIIGRSSTADVRLTSSGVSREHARIQRLADGSYFIEDLGSRNGTMVDGARVERRPLTYGDRIYLGLETVLLFTHHEPMDNQLQQLQKMQAMGELAAGIAHDFNNLLGVVVASLDYLVKQPAQGELGRDDIRECLDDANAASRRAADLTKQLLSFASPGHLEDSVIDVTELVHEAAQLARRTFPRSIAINISVERDLAVRGDRTQLLQVLMNLCINARDAMAEGGVLSLRAEPAENKDLAEVPVRSLVQHVVIIVEDNGIGIDDETQGRIFQPFFTTKQKPGGGGLGLSTAYNIVRKHGGHLAVESSVGLGTRFSIFLPHATTRVSDRATLQTDVDAPTQVRHAAPANVRVLVVDDEPLVRRSTERLLRKIGYDVHSVQSGSEALAYYTANASDVTLVLLDINMPEMNGEEVFRALRAFDPQARVVLFSGYWDETRIRRILQEGALAFVRKPADAETLHAALAQAITA